MTANLHSCNYNPPISFSLLKLLEISLTDFIVTPATLPASPFKCLGNFLSNLDLMF